SNSLTLQISPFAAQNKASPVERVLPVFALQHRQLSLPQRFAASQPLFEACVEGGHRLARHAIAHRLEAHQQSFGASQKERTAQAINALEVLHFLDTGLTSGESD